MLERQSHQTRHLLVSLLSRLDRDVDGVFETDISSYVTALQLLDGSHKPGGFANSQQALSMRTANSRSAVLTLRAEIKSGGIEPSSSSDGIPNALWTGTVSEAKESPRRYPSVHLFHTGYLDPRADIQDAHIDGFSGVTNPTISTIIPQYVDAAGLPAGTITSDLQDDN